MSAATVRPMSAHAPELAAADSSCVTERITNMSTAICRCDKCKVKLKGKHVLRVEVRSVISSLVSSTCKRAPHGSKSHRSAKPY